MKRFFALISILLSLSACDLLNVSLVNYIRGDLGNRPGPGMPLIPSSPPSSLDTVTLASIKVEKGTDYSPLEGTGSDTFTIVVPPAGSSTATLTITTAGEIVTKVDGVPPGSPQTSYTKTLSMGARPATSCRDDTVIYVSIDNGGTEKNFKVRIVWAIPVSNSSELAGIGANPATLGEDYFIINDIANSGSWIPMGDTTNPFRGSLRSREGKKIDLNVNLGTGYYFGLFGCTEDAVFDGLTLHINAANLNYQFAGALAGKVNNTVIKNIVLSGSIYNTHGSLLPIMGGLAGNTSDTIISGVTSSVAVNSQSSNATNSVYAGGLVGNSAGGSISHSCATGDVVVNHSHWTNLTNQAFVLGGLVGIADDTTITSSYAAGKVMFKKTGSYYLHAGGLVGRIYNGGTITGSYTLGEISVHASLSSGSTYPAYSAIGGLAGSLSGAGAAIKQCYAAGAIIEDPANSNITGSSYIGGLVGYSNNGAVQKSAAIIPSLPNIGGDKHRVAGNRSGGTLSQNSALAAMSIGGNVIAAANRHDDLNGLSKTQAELKTEATYPGWNFSTVWKMPGPDGAGYPILQWQ